MKQVFTAVIIDDEKSALEVLKEIVSIYVPSVKIIGMESNLFAGIKLINESQPDILFLDIEMPAGSGFDFLDNLKYQDFYLIFTTAHSQYAIQAIKKGIHDFLMKPIDPDELVESIKRLSSTTKHSKENEEQKLVVQCLDKIHMLNIDEIIRCESDSNYTHIKLNSGKRITVTMTLKAIEEKLSSERFVRIHQSHLVNKTEIIEVGRGEQSHVLLTNGEKIPVSFRKRPLIKTLLD